MKILIISDAWHPQMNGVVRTYEELIRVLRAKGHEVAIIGPGDCLFSFPMPGYAEIRLTIGPYGKLKRTIRDFQADHLHIATEGPLGIAARRYCLKHNIAFTTCYHTQFPDYVARRVRKIWPRLARFSKYAAWNHIRRFHTKASKVLVASSSLERLLKVKGVQAPMHHFTRGVDTDVFHPGAKKLFKDLARPIALYVGRIAVEKSIEDFLSMPWSGSKVLVGDGPMRAELEIAYPDVQFVGKKTGTELADHYRAADVFVFPSRTDTFGMVLVEALACGLPVAAYPVIGPLDIITESHLGVLDDDLSYAAEQAALLIHADLRSAHVREHYTWELAADQFLKAIEVHASAALTPPASPQTQSPDA